MDFTEPLDKGELVYFGGGLFQTARKTSGDPTDDPQSYNCIVSGVLDVSYGTDDIERVDYIKCTLSDGATFKHETKQGPRFHGFDIQDKKIIKDDFYIDIATHTIKCATKDDPEQDEWEELNIRGSRGRTGKRGESVKGDIGKQGVSVSDIYTDHGHMIVELDNGKQFNFPMGQDQDIKQPIVKYRGEWSSLKSFATGDVVRSYAGLSLCINPTSDDDPNNPESWLVMVPSASNKSGLAPLPMVWGGEWLSGQEYNNQTVVRDSGWLAIANKLTTDRPAPQPIGNSDYIYKGTSPATPIPAKTIYSGVKITGGDSGYYINSYSAYVTTGNLYRIYATNNEGVVDELQSFVSSTTGWVEFSISPIIVQPHTSFSIIQATSEPDPTPTTFNGDWDYLTPNSPTALPLAGEIVQRNGNTETLYISKTDDAAGDRGAELLGLVSGDTITGVSMVWDVQEPPTDNGGYVSIVVGPASQGSPDGVANFVFETVDPTPITVVVDADYWLTHQPPSGAIKGLYSVDSGAAVETNTAYGVNLNIQNVTVSEDWDLMASSTDVGGSSGAAPEAYYFIKVADVLDIPDTFTSVATLTSPADTPAGTYEVKFAINWAFNRTTSSAYFQWRIDGGPWFEIEAEPADSTDKHVSSYFYPTDFTGGLHVVEIEARKETGAGTLDVLFADIIMDRKI